MQLALYQPEIAGNVGAVLRTAACFGVPVHIIEPCGFPLSSRDLKRAAMDYADAALPTRHADWAAFADAMAAQQRRVVLLTTKGVANLDAFAFAQDDVLLLGSEGSGVPEAIHDAVVAKVRIPLASGMRSLNLSVSAGIAVFEGLRQTGQLPRI